MSNKKLIAEENIANDTMGMLLYGTVGIIVCLKYILKLTWKATKFFFRMLLSIRKGFKVI